MFGKKEVSKNAASSKASPPPAAPANAQDKKNEAPAQTPPPAVKALAPATTTLVPNQSQALAPAPVSSLNLEEDAGAGQEGMTRDDFAIPRIVILQDLSPFVKKTEDKYVEGAEAGMLMDTVSNALFPGFPGITIIPVSYRRTHIEWIPRTDGGGFVADHGPDPAILDKCTKDDKGNYVNAEGNHIVATAEYFIYIVDPETGAYLPFVLSMSKSQLKKAKAFNTMINQLRIPRAQGLNGGNGGTFNPAMFYLTYQLETTPERNDQGSWFGFKIRPGKPVTELPNGEDIYLAARNFRKSIAEGKVKASEHVETGAGVPASEGDDAPM